MLYSTDTIVALHHAVRADQASRAERLKGRKQRSVSRAVVRETAPTQAYQRVVAPR